MLKLVLYDLDGTLVDTRADITRSVNHMMRVLGRKPLSQEQVQEAVGHGMLALIHTCLGTDDADSVRRGLSIYEDHYAKHMLDTSALYPGARELLDYFVHKHQAVVTNKPNPFSVQILQALDVAEYFFEIIAGDECYPKKPDPAAVSALMQQTASTAQQTVVIGDSPTDIETGRRAGVATVGVSHGFVARHILEDAQPDFLVHDLPELLHVFKSNGW